MKLNIITDIFPLFTLLAMLSGCSVGPVYAPPVDETPNEWHSNTPPTLTTASSPEDLIWWESLQDPLLNELMAYAASQNIDLQIAATRVLQARTEANAKKYDLYPRLDGSANYGHIYYSKDALVNGLIGTAAPTKKHVRRNVNFYEFGFDAEWEIDLFGMTAHEIAALKAHEEAVQEALCGIWVTLSAEIAKNYIDIRTLQHRLGIMHRSIKAQADAIELTQKLKARGIVNEMDICKAEAEYSTLKAQPPLLELGIARAIHRLSILLGYPPGELFACLEPASPLPQLPCEIPIGMPSELLRRRPDIRRAERELSAATERIGSAIAALFPRFSLRGFIGDISTHAGSLFSPSSATWLAGPQLLFPIFNSRLLLQDVEYNKIATQEAIYTYQKTVLDALEEAENAIAAFKHEGERESNLEEAYQKYQKTLALADQLYQEGVKDYFAVIESTRSLLSAEDTHVQSQSDLLMHYISLYKALGGSWK